MPENRNTSAPGDFHPLHRHADTRIRDFKPGWLLALLLALATLALYWSALRMDFLDYDDDCYVTANPQVQKGLTWETFCWAWGHPVADNWHPLTVLSHVLVFQFCGLNPWGHHLANVLLHAANAALVCLWLRRTTGAVWKSLAVAALFAVHPLRVESVAWVAERKDVLCAFFFLLTLMAYARAVKAPLAGQAEDRAGQSFPAAQGKGSKESKGEDGKLRARNRLSSILYPPPSTGLHLWFPLFLFALALLSKPMAVTLPFVLLLLDYWPLGRWGATAAARVTHHTSVVTRHDSPSSGGWCSRSSRSSRWPLPPAW